MRHLSLFSLLAVAISLAFQAAAAQKVKHEMVTREYSVIGQRSCKDWREARAKDGSQDIGEAITAIAASSWLMGYLSGVNSEAHSKGDFLAGIDYDVAVEWTDTYCQKHPRDKLGDAANALLSKLGLEP